MSVIDFRGYATIPETLKNLADPAAEMSRYKDAYHVGSIDELTMTPDQLLATLDSTGTAHMVCAGVGAPNEKLAEFVAGGHGRLSGIATISPRNGVTAAACEVARASEMGLRLIGLAPYRDHMYASDRRYYPTYAKAAELNMGVVIHTSFNFGEGMLLDMGRPIYLDQVATDFPELPLIASHGGWPWMNEMIGVAWRHEHVYIELSATRPKYMMRPGSGWEMLFNYAEGPLRTKILWGSNWPFMIPVEQLLSETQEWPLSERTMHHVMFANAQQVLREVGVPVGEAQRHE